MKTNTDLMIRRIVVSNKMFPMSKKVGAFDKMTYSKMVAEAMIMEGWIAEAMVTMTEGGA